MHKFSCTLYLTASSLIEQYQCVVNFGTWRKGEVSSADSSGTCAGTVNCEGGNSVSALTIVHLMQSLYWTWNGRYAYGDMCDVAKGNWIMIRVFWNVMLSPVEWFLTFHWKKNSDVVTLQAAHFVDWLLNVKALRSFETSEHTLRGHRVTFQAT
jgi:hypothetical protein